MVNGYLSLLCSINQSPLKYWAKQLSPTGHIRKTLDLDLSENVVELRNADKNKYGNISIVCPAYSHQLLDIKLPILVIVIKNVGAKCQFRLQIIDSNKIRHYFHFYNAKFENPRNVRIPLTQSVEVKFEPDWNELKLDLPALTRKAFQATYEATQRLELCGSCRLRRVYFIANDYNKHELSADLCRQFFGSYMMKWGIRRVERATQTELINEKIENVKKSKMFPVLRTVISSSDSFNLEIDEKHDKNFEYTLVRIKENALKYMRAKCRNKIEDFFNVSPRTICCSQNPKFRCLPMLGAERQKILLASVSFFNDLKEMCFPCKNGKCKKMRHQCQRGRDTNKVFSNIKNSYNQQQQKQMKVQECEKIKNEIMDLNLITS